jgi:hypothetical protein
MNTRKEIGDTNQKARAAAMKTFIELRGKNVKDMNVKQLADLVVVLLQWIGLVDEHGVIK